MLLDQYLEHELKKDKSESRRILNKCVLVPNILKKAKLNKKLKKVVEK